MSEITFVASFIAMGCVAGWRLAAILLVGIAWHEYGHLREARRLKLKTGRMIFLPFLGGIAPIRERLPSRWAEVTVTLAGPFFGFLMAAVLCLVGVGFHKPLFLAAAFIQAVMNCVNLVPINPLDGGRLCKSVVFSLHPRVGVALLAVTTAAALTLAVCLGRPVFVLVAWMGYVDLKGEVRRMSEASARSDLCRILSMQGFSEEETQDLLKDLPLALEMPPLSRTQIVCAFAGWAGLALALVGITLQCLRDPGFSAALHGVTGV